jgi:lipoyl(octanoyl) transferase
MHTEYPFNVRNWGRCDYSPLFQAMKHFTQRRTEHTPDEIWLAEHNPAYTLGQQRTPEDIIKPIKAPIIQTDRGGRITYHGPGQLIIYPLLNLKRLQCHLRMLVDALENTLIRLLAEYHITAYSERKAPGIYIQNAKVASLGIRIIRNYCYHGLAINVDMDLTPFQAIYPCGLQNITMTQLVDWIGPISLAKVGEHFLNYFYQQPLYHRMHATNIPNQQITAPLLSQPT